MTISGDYSSPVLVNGFSCRNCAEVDQAKKNIDPADPLAGPFGANSTKHGSAAKAKDRVFDARMVDPAELAKAHQQVTERQQGTDAMRAYGTASQSAGTYLNLTI